MRKAARAIPQVWSKTFLIGIVLLENIQAVKELVADIRQRSSGSRLCSAES
jgi:hypothetical protein